MSDDDDRVRQVLAALEPTPADEVAWPVSRRTTLRALAALGLAGATGSASAQSVGTVRADTAVLSNYGSEPTSDGYAITIDDTTFTLGGGDLTLPEGTAASEVATPDAGVSEIVGPDGNVVFEAGRDIPDSVVLQFDAQTFSQGDSTWQDDVGTNDMSIEGDPQEGTFSDGSASVEADGVDDYGLYSMPSELDGSGFVSSTTEFSIQTTTSNDDSIFGLERGTNERFYCRLNTDEGFNSDNGNFLVFVQESDSAELVFSPANNPNINDGERHDISIVLNDVSTNDVEMIIDGTSVSVSIDTRGNSSPSSFSWGEDMAIFALNSSGSISRNAEIGLGIYRMHNEAVSEQTIGE